MTPLLEICNQEVLDRIRLKIFINIRNYLKVKLLQKNTKPNKIPIIPKRQKKILLLMNKRSNFKGISFLLYEEDKTIFYFK